MFDLSGEESDSRDSPLNPLNHNYKTVLYCYICSSPQTKIMRAQLLSLAFVPKLIVLS